MTRSFPRTITLTFLTLSGNRVSAGNLIYCVRLLIKTDPVCILIPRNIQHLEFSLLVAILLLYIARQYEGVLYADRCKRVRFIQGKSKFAANEGLTVGTILIGIQPMGTH